MVHILGVHILPVLGADEERIDTAFAVVIGDLGFGIREQRGMVLRSQTFDGAGRQHERDRQHLAGLIGGIAEHHSLVAGTFAVNAKGNVRALLCQLDGEVEVIADAGLVLEQFKGNETLDIGLVLRGDLAGYGDVVVLDQRLHCHTAGPVMFQAVRHDGIRDLVADLIGMPGGHLLGGEQHTEALLSEMQKAPAGRSREGFMRLFRHCYCTTGFSCTQVNWCELACTLFQIYRWLRSISPFRVGMSICGW